MNIRAWFPVKQGEGRRVFLAVAYFFLLLFSYYLLRPVRETFGIARGADQLPYVWTGTLLVMGLIQPLFSSAVARFRRRVFIPGTLHLASFCLALFAGLYFWLPNHGGHALGLTFYVWLSIFNLFVVSIFWAFMADLFDREAGGRLFGLLAIGGTLGAIAGSGFTEMFTHGFTVGTQTWTAGPGWLFGLSALALQGSVLCVRGLFVLQGDSDGRTASQEPGPGPWEGFKLLGNSRLLQLIALYMLLFTLTSTFLYVVQGRVVEGAFASRAARTVAFARIDLGVNLLTLVCQVFLTHRLVARFGIPAVLMILPVLTLGGFGALWLWPGFATLAAFQVLRRGLHYAVARPVREMLYIPLGPDAKYKAKSFIDTFVYRSGDLLGIWMTPLLSALAMPIGLPALGISALWGLGAQRLGRRIG